MPTTISADEQTRWRLGLKRQACEVLGIRPSAIRLRLLTRANPHWMRGLFGYAVAPNHLWTRPRTGLVTYIHEMLHLLFPRQCHGWIFGAAYILADRPRWTIPMAIEEAGYILADGTQSKETLMRRTRAAAERKGLA